MVLKKENQNKGNKIVKEAFPQSFSDSKMIDYWKNLKKAGLISEKKFNNLQKNNVEDILTKGFINRQLVETRQIVKSVANLILDYYNEQIDVIEVKASLSTSVRKMLTYEKKDNNGFWEENKDNCTLPSVYLSFSVYFFNSSSTSLNLEDAAVGFLRNCFIAPA